MGVHSGRPQDVSNTQLGTQAGPSGSLSIISAVPRVWKEWGEVFLQHAYHTSSEITLSQECVILLLSVNHVKAAMCFLPHGHQSDWRMLLLRSQRPCCRYYSEIIVFDLLHQCDSSCDGHLYVIWGFFLLYVFIYCTSVSSWSDKKCKVRSGLTWRVLHDCETHLMHIPVHQFWFVLLYSI